MKSKQLYKFSIAFFLLIIYILTFIFFIYRRNLQVLNNMFISNDEYIDIINERTPYDGDILISLTFNNEKLFKVSNKDEFFYSVPVKDKNGYNPYVTHNSSLTDTKIKFYDNELTDELIKDNKTLKIIVYNKEYYKDYNVVVTTLPIMNISYDITEENINRLENKDEDVYGKFYLYDNENEVVTSTNLKFHVRGATSVSYPKKGFKLSLKDDRGNSVNKNLLNMRHDDDWILNSLYNDPEKIRNSFSARLWYDSCASDNQFDVNAGMYYKYVESFINGEYNGLYAIGFQIDDKQLKNDNKDYLYKKERWFKEELNNLSDISSYYSIKSDKSDAGDAIDAIKDYYRILLTNNSHELLDYVDVDNNIDFILFNLFIQNVDSTGMYSSKNLYLALKNKGERYKALYIPWDMDLTFGNDYDESKDNNTSEYSIDYNYNDVIYYMNPVGILLEKEDEIIINKIKDKYLFLRRTSWNDEKLIILVDMYENIYTSGAVLRDKDCWPNSLTNDSNNLETFKSYVINRAKAMDEYIDNL